jgi:hypothetical protein
MVAAQSAACLTVLGGSPSPMLNVALPTACFDSLEFPSLADSPERNAYLAGIKRGAYTYPVATEAKK